MPDKLRIVLDIESDEDQVLAAAPFRLTGQGAFDVDAEPVAMGHPEDMDRAANVYRAVAEGRGIPDDRPTHEGRSTVARLSRWVPRNVPDRRVREDGTDPVTMTGGQVYALLLEVAEWSYRHGTDDVAQSPRNMTEFFGHGQGVPAAHPWERKGEF